MASTARMRFRSTALLSFALLSWGCQDQPVPGQGAPEDAANTTGLPAAPGGAPEAVGQRAPDALDVAQAVAVGEPAAAGQAVPGRGSSAWSGEATGGYTGNRLSFVLSADKSQIEDVTFEGHWDCADGIETTISGPSGSFPVDGGRIEFTSVDPPDGGATAERFELTGQIGADRAQGTLRINLNALGCDTRVLSWSATPVAR